MRKYISILISAISFVTVNAQLQNPASVKWRQIKTDNFTVVFPKEVESRGIETAKILETAYKPARNSLHVATPKTTVFLYNQSIISNGFTALAPYQIVFYSTPPQEASQVGGTDWLQTLAVHEYRHAVQYAKLDNNLTYFAGSLFGDVGKAVFMNFSVPLWVFEGDAVCSETAFSLEGRGRLPVFKKDIRTLELENIRYSYYKAYLGSYKDYFPNHYYLGYLMTSYIRTTYGDQAWNNILTRTTKYSFWPWTFSRSLKKYTGFKLTKTYENCLNEYKNQWEQGIANLQTTSFEQFKIPANSSYTNYSYPQFVNDNEIVAFKSGFDHVPTLVLLSNGTEKKLSEINPVDRIQSNGNKVVWATEKADIRWGQRSYSNILVYDLNEKNKKIITRRGKYFAPSISSSRDYIAAVKYDKSMHCKLVILNSISGREEKTFGFNDDEFIRMPSWSKDGNKIVFTVSKGQDRKISVLDLNSGVIQDITSYSTESVTNPVFYNDYILYNSPISGIDGIYAINISSKEKYTVAMDKYGVYNPSVSTDGSKIVFQNYTVQGYSLSTIKSDQSEWRKVETQEYLSDDYAERLVKLENGISIFDSLNFDTNEKFDIKKYRPLFHSVQIHSWAPFQVNNGVGFGVLSGDKLNTTSIVAAVNYFPKATAHREYLNLSYSRFFPVIDLMASYGRRYNYEKDTAGDMDFRPTDEKLFRLGVTLPFNFSRSIHTTTLDLNAAYNSIYYSMPEDEKFADPAENKDEVTAMEYGMKFIHYRQASRRDLNPRLGQALEVKYWNTPFGEGADGERFVGHAALYLPGLYNHHSLALKGEYEASSENFRNGIYALTTSAEFTRGYNPYISEIFKKGTIEYTFPVAYPDAALGSIIYFKRLYSSLFYDYGILDWQNDQHLFRSVGIDLNFTLHLFNLIQLPIEMGVRTSYLIDDEKLAVEFLLFNAAF